MKKWRTGELNCRPCGSRDKLNGYVVSFSNQIYMHRPQNHAWVVYAADLILNVASLLGWWVYTADLPCAALLAMQHVTLQILLWCIPGAVARYTADSPVVHPLRGDGLLQTLLASLKQWQWQVTPQTIFVMHCSRAETLCGRQMQTPKSLKSLMSWHVILHTFC